MSESCSFSIITFLSVCKSVRCFYQSSLVNVDILKTSHSSYSKQNNLCVCVCVCVCVQAVKWINKPDSGGVASHRKKEAPLDASQASKYSLNDLKDFI